MADLYKDLIQESTILTSLRYGSFADEAAGNHTITGIKTRDKLIAVLGFTTTEAAPPNIIAVQDIKSEFTISAADTIENAGGTTFIDGWALVIWLAIPEELG